MPENNELYEILRLIFSVKENCEVNDIKESFRKIAKVFHPDINKEVNPDIFVGLLKGYEILLREHDKKENKPVEIKSDVNEEFDEDQIYVLACKKVSNTFQTLVEQTQLNTLLIFDIKTHIEKLFKNETGMLHSNISQIKSEVKLLEKIKTRVKCKEDKLLFIDAIESIIRKKIKLISKDKNKIKINEISLKLLNEYSFDILYG